MPVFNTVLALLFVIQGGSDQPNGGQQYNITMFTL